MSTPRSAKIRVSSTPSEIRKPQYFSKDLSFNNIVKSASTSDLTEVNNSTIESSVHSESEIYVQAENKENGTLFAKPDEKRRKRSSKTKSMTNNRQILTNYN